MVTITDIAKKAGVSPATVARVIHNNGYVSKDKQHVIEQVIKTLGYVPNKVARGLRNRKTNFIGHILPLSGENPFFTRVGSAINSAAEAAGFHVLTAISHGNPDKEQLLIEDLVGLMVEAIIFTAQTTCSTELIEWVLSQGVQVVMIERPRDISGIDIVLLDGFEGSRLAARHLHAHGHSKIAFIGVDSKRHFVDEQRYKGFLSATSQYGWNIPAHWIRLLPDYTVAYGYEAMEGILATEEYPTAVFAGSDILACGALQCLYENHLRVPDDI